MHIFLNYKQQGKIGASNNLIISSKVFLLKETQPSCRNCFFSGNFPHPLIKLGTKEASSKQFSSFIPFQQQVGWERGIEQTS